MTILPRYLLVHRPVRRTKKVTLCVSLAKQKLKNVVLGRARAAAPVKTPAAPPEPLTYDEAQKMVQFEVDGHISRVNINEELEVYSKEDFPDEESGEAKAEPPPGWYLPNPQE